MLNRLPDFSEGSEEAVGESEPEDLVDLGELSPEDFEGAGEEDSSNVIILRPTTIGCSCCSCSTVIEITVVGTSDATTVFEQLLESTNLNLLCEPCTEEYRRLQDGRT